MTAEADIVSCPHCGQKNRVQATGDGKPVCGKCGKPLPWVVNAGDQDFAKVVEQSRIPVLVDVWAPWCGPCRMVSPVLEQLATEKAGDIKLVKINADDAPELSRRFDIRSIPTLMVFRSGEAVATQIGATPAAVLRPWLEDALSN
ncbi:thioredoxin TrxC [Kribbella sp. VKM Ac-2566]|uniref:thioredoxin TrxC n=1 Tax=Kribbella sp. VKM Ac-2566 TaxID=2512218 RepID=UPI001062C8D4|nr:thioredoxin TrxC [Kribbella sp. VKM Ac-2566]TDW86507.1 thioredoxin [Kribbella sp. VKM Ac-2566]